MENFVRRVLDKNIKVREYIDSHDFGVYTPVNHSLIKEAPSSGIFIDEEVVKRMIELAHKTSDMDLEYSFILVGNVLKGNIIHIKGFYQHNDRVNSRSAPFDGRSTRVFEHVISGNTSCDCVLLCHTHPDRGLYYMNFSLGDINGLIRTIYDYRRFKYIDNVAWSVLTGDGQFLTCFYDPSVENIYKISRVIVNCKDGKFYDYDIYVKNYFNGNGRNRRDGG